MNNAAIHFHSSLSPTTHHSKQLNSSQRKTIALASFADRSTNWNLQNDPYVSKNSNSSNKLRTTKKDDVEEEEERLVLGSVGWERKVNCEVEVVSWRERRVKAEILVDADIHSVWTALTDYERLADFIPNLVSSERIPCPHPGRIWLQQRGLQRALYWHIEARVVLDLQEFVNSVSILNLEYDRELQFSMVDGDFKKFEGKWSIKSTKRSSKTNLCYEVSVIPRFSFPAIFLERIIRSDLPVNLQALACRAECDFEGSQRLLTTENPTGASVASVSKNSINIDDAVVSASKLNKEELKGKFIKSTFGPLSPCTSEVNCNWGIYGQVCNLDRPCIVDEVHLRRFDGLLENGGVHRCVVASITVKAPVREVWNILTAYESLPEFVPNLAISKILSRESNKVRVLQEGCKGLLYMVLHARVVLDLCEHREQEISFEQVEGDFDSFRGKWILEQLGSHHTLLKYTVESKMQKNSFLSEAIMEEVIYEDLPSNLCAIRDYIEEKTADTTLTTSDITTTDVKEFSPLSNHSSANYRKSPEYNSVGNSSTSSRQRPKVPGLQQDFDILKGELLTFISEHGQDGFMPMRKLLRKHGRVDIEKAITRMGGFTRIASLLNLSLAYKHRKPKGYWDNLENMQEEISRFQQSWGMDPSFMPSRKSFERAGDGAGFRGSRYDIARALEKWGGLHEVSRLLSLKVRHPNNRQASLARERKTESLTSNDISGEEEAPSGTYVSQDTEKWLMKLKELDINWVE
ncbi:hypothetical protein LIER_15012 [Lithospermum erythrorhizon]|uniref:Coenzyme Q-binding protein COQ10 START domain-containing protein n=1 Tax=Lithospermum erythrorhizon TaxID=34254 RepID=A0AAV3Q5T8_LITER